MEERTNQQGRDWKVRAGITYLEGAVRRYQEGLIYVHGNALTAVRQKAGRILRTVHPNILSVAFLNTHPIDEREVFPETAGFRDIEICV